jgi:hypothetical protein
MRKFVIAVLALATCTGGYAVAADTAPTPCPETGIVCKADVPFCNGAVTITYYCEGCDPECGLSPPASPCVLAFTPTCSSGTPHM